MVRVVPIIHRTPPPPLDKLFEAPVVPEAQPTTSTLPARNAPFGEGNPQRRSYFAGKFGGNAASLPSSSKSTSPNGVTGPTPREFSLFDYLQELVRTCPTFLFFPFLGSLDALRASSAPDSQLSEPSS